MACKKFMAYFTHNNFFAAQASSIWTKAIIGALFGRLIPPVAVMQGVDLGYSQARLFGLQRHETGGTFRRNSIGCDLKLLKTYVVSVLHDTPSRDVWFLSTTYRTAARRELPVSSITKTWLILENSSRPSRGISLFRVGGARHGGSSWFPSWHT